jgi:protein TonB
LRKLFDSGDYPAQALSEGDSGITRIVALIDQKGGVAECMVDETSGIATLDAMTCIIVKERAKFVPAVGQDGKPARSATTTRVRWISSL